MKGSRMNTEQLEEICQAVNNSVLQQLSKQVPILRHFKFEHLPPHLAMISRKFAQTAVFTAFLGVQDKEQRQQALQRLLEAKDCAVRACIPE